MYIYGYASTIHQVNNNVVNNINQNKTTGSGFIYGIYTYMNCPTAQYNGNSITNLTNAGTGGYYGLYAASAITNSNSINSNVTSGISSAGTILYAAYFTGGGGSIRNNTIKNITSTSTSTTAVIAGMYVLSPSAGSQYNIFNNIIGDIKAPAGSNAITAGSSRVRGMWIAATAATTDVNVFNNTVYLNATSTANPFTSSALYVSTSTIATSGKLKMVGNIFVNNSTPTGTGKAVAYVRSSTSFTNYDALNSGLNVFYAGTPGTNNVIYWDATNNITTVPAFQTLVLGEAGSFTENPTFLSTVSANANYLRINPATATLIESGSLINPILNNDIDGDIRAGAVGYTGTGSTPDIGADEFAGTTPAPQIFFGSVSLT